MNQRWPVPSEYKDAMIKRLIRIVADPNSSNRDINAACRTLMAAEQQNQQDEQHEVGVEQGRNRFLDVAAGLGIAKALEQLSGDGTATDHLTVDAGSVEPKD
jgi:hypothetical protein